MVKWLDIDPHSGVPIYVQIADQIRHAIAVGALQPGEQLPTVRQLASELTIAPNTIVKAYNELQSANLIESRAGIGTTVSEISIDLLRQWQLGALISRLALVVQDAKRLGLTIDELRTHLETQINDFYC